VRHQHYEAVRAEARTHADTYAGVAAQKQTCARVSGAYSTETERLPMGASQDMTTRDHILLSAVRCDSDMDTHDYGTRRARGGYSGVGAHEARLHAEQEEATAVREHRMRRGEQEEATAT
jgi:hypothetical protein